MKDFRFSLPGLPILLVIFCLGALVCIPGKASAQPLEKLKKLLPKGKTDTTYLDNHQLKWSLRGYGIVKTQVLSVKNSVSKSTIAFAPNNRLSVGGGLSYKALFLDIAVNLKLNQDNPTKRFDFQSALLVKQNLLIVHLQDYRGFQVLEEFNLGRNPFRKDIRSFSAGLSYTYLIQGKKLSLASVFAGTQTQKRSTGAFGVGVFSLYNQLLADSSIIPSDRLEDFNSYAMIRESKAFTLGVMGNYSYYWVLPKNFFLFGSIAPGIGYSNQQVIATEKYHVPKDYSLRLSTWASAGYNGPRYYAVISLLNEFHHTPLGYDNRGVVNVGKTKLVVGWRFDTKRK